MTDDELIAAVQERLDAGAFGLNGLVSSEQANYHGMWSAIVEFSAAKLNEAYPSFVAFELRDLIYRLIDERPQMREVFALNTTRYGREEEDVRWVIGMS